MPGAFTNALGQSPPSPQVFAMQAPLSHNPLDRETQDFLTATGLGEITDSKPLDIEESRARLNSLFLEYAPAPVTIGRRQRRQLMGPNGAFNVDLFWPQSQRVDQPLPLLIFFHGGGWFQGDLECYASLMQTICAQAGVAVMNVGYHLAPEHKFPAGLNDCHQALLWSLEHAQELGIDPRRIVLMGDSAGGNLCAALNLRVREKLIAPIYAQVLLYPILDATEGASYPSRATFGQGNYVLSDSQIHWTRSQYLDDQRLASHPHVSPMHCDQLQGLPQTLIITAGCDPLRDEAKIFADKLRSAGISVEYQCVSGAIHGFLSLSGGLSSGRNTLSDLNRRLRQLLQPELESSTS